VAVVNGDYDLPAPYLGISDGLSERRQIGSRAHVDHMSEREIPFERPALFCASWHQIP